MLLFNAHRHLHSMPALQPCQTLTISPGPPPKPGIYQPGSETPDSHPGSPYRATSSSRLWIGTNAKAVNIAQASGQLRSKTSSPHPTAYRYRKALSLLRGPWDRAPRTRGSRGPRVPRPAAGWASSSPACQNQTPALRLQRWELLSPRASPPARPGRGARAPATCAAGGGRAAPAPAGEREGAAGGAGTSPFPGTATLSAPPKSPSPRRQRECPPLPPPPGTSRLETESWGSRGSARTLRAEGPHDPAGQATAPAPGSSSSSSPRLPPLTRGRSCSWGSAASRCSRGSGAACARRCGR